MRSLLFYLLAMAASQHWPRPFIISGLIQDNSDKKVKSSHRAHGDRLLSTLQSTPGGRARAVVFSKEGPALKQP